MYDLVTASGVFFCSHMPKESFREIFDYLKVGGRFITAMRDFYYRPGEECGYYDALKELVDEGRIELLEEEIFERGQSNPVHPLFAVQDSRLLIFKKTA